MIAWILIIGTMAGGLPDKVVHVRATEAQCRQIAATHKFGDRLRVSIDGVNRDDTHFFECAWARDGVIEGFACEGGPGAFVKGKKC